jgi:hypothetical protein
MAVVAPLNGDIGPQLAQVKLLSSVARLRLELLF